MDIRSFSKQDWGGFGSETSLRMIYQSAGNENCFTTWSRPGCSGPRVVDWIALKVSVTFLYQ